VILTRTVIIIVASFAAGLCLVGAVVRLMPRPPRRDPGWAVWLLVSALVDAWIVASNYASIRRVVVDLALDDPATYQSTEFKPTTNQVGPP
jgi:hypothetical protein